MLEGVQKRIKFDQHQCKGEKNKYDFLLKLLEKKSEIKEQLFDIFERKPLLKERLEKILNTPLDAFLNFGDTKAWLKEALDTDS